MNKKDGIYFEIWNGNMTKSVTPGDPIWVVVEKKELQPPHSIVKYRVSSVGASIDPGFTRSIAEIEADDNPTLMVSRSCVDIGEYQVWSDHFSCAIFTNRQDAEDFRDKQKIDDIYGDRE
jgi:hypothetical protein